MSHCFRCDFSPCRCDLEQLLAAAEERAQELDHELLRERQGAIGREEALEEAREVAEHACKMLSTRPKDWSYEDADLFLNGVPWKRSAIRREISAEVLRQLRDKEVRP